LGENVNDMLGLRGEWRRFGQQSCLNFHGAGRRGEKVVAEEGGQAESTESHACALEKLATGKKMVFQMNGMLVFIHL
jgi:hypothetical protein